MAQDWSEIRWVSGSVLDETQHLLGHTKLESTLRYLGIEVEDALEMSEQTEA